MNAGAFLYQIEWRQPWWLLLALLPLLPAALGRLRRGRVVQYAEPHLRPWAVREDASGTGPGRAALGLTAWLLLGLAAAGPRLPQWQTEEGGPAGLQHRGVDIMVVLDLSPSMEAEDVPPRRSQRARLELRDLLARFQGERLGLAVFSGRPALLMPPSTDYHVFDFYLGMADGLLKDSPGSALPEALDLAAETLETGPGTSRAVLLVTDGDADALEGSRAAAQRLRSRGIPLFILAVSTEAGAPVPAAQGGYLQRQGRPVMSRRDTERLTELAALTGGRYAPVADGDGDWRTLYGQGLARLPAAPQPGQRLRTWQELYPWFLAPAILLLALSQFPLMSLGRAVGLLLVGGILVPGYSPARAWADGGGQAAYQAYRSGDFGEARYLYGRLAGYAGRMGEGASAYRLGDYGQAAGRFIAAWLAARDAGQQADALFNLGNSRFMAGEYALAVEAYRGALGYWPEHGGARANLAVTLGALSAASKGRGAEPTGTGSDEYGRYDETEEPGFPPEEKDEPHGAFGQERSQVGDAVARGKLRAQGAASGQDKDTAEADYDARYLAGLKKLELIEDRPAVLMESLGKKEQKSSGAPPGGKPW